MGRCPSGLLSGGACWAPATRGGGCLIFLYVGVVVVDVDYGDTVITAYGAEREKTLSQKFRPYARSLLEPRYWALWWTGGAGGVVERTALGRILASPKKKFSPGCGKELERPVRL